VWILWASLQIRYSGSKSAGNNKSFPVGAGGDILGPMTDEDDGITYAETMGKIEAVATIAPTGAHAVVLDGWDMRRRRAFAEYHNGTNTLRSTGWDDTSDSAFKDLLPDNDEKIYDIDGPANGYYSVNHTAEIYENFWQWVTWNDETCSATQSWHYQSWIDEDLGEDDTELNDVGLGHITIPTNSPAHYAPR